MAGTVCVRNLRHFNIYPDARMSWPLASYPILHDIIVTGDM